MGVVANNEKPGSKNLMGWEKGAKGGTHGALGGVKKQAAKGL